MSAFDRPPIYFHNREFALSTDQGTTNLLSYYFVGLGNGCASTSISGRGRKRQVRGDGKLNPFLSELPLLPYSTSELSLWYF